MRQDKIATALLDELWDAGFKLNGPECDKVDEIGRRIEGEHAAQERADFINGIRNAEAHHGITITKGDV